MIIEDEKDEREVMVESLTTIGYLCSSACDGSAGIAMAKEELFDLFIVDMRMQGINGMQVIDQFKALYPLACVIAISGYLSDKLIKRSQDEGFLCLQKPFTMDELSKAIVTILGPVSPKHLTGVERMKRILIVDDEADVREHVAEELTRRGWETATAKDGVEAVLRVIDGGWSSVLMDIRMPGLNGVEALRIIRRLDPRLPVIMFTGQAGHGEMLETKRLGAFACILKPVVIEKLQELLSEATQKNDTTIRFETQ